MVGSGGQRCRQSIRPVGGEVVNRTRESRRRAHGSAATHRPLRGSSRSLLAVACACRSPAPRRSARRPARSCRLKEPVRLHTARIVSRLFADEDGLYKKCKQRETVMWHDAHQLVYADKLSGLDACSSTDYEVEQRRRDKRLGQHVDRCGLRSINPLPELAAVNLQQQRVRHFQLIVRSRAPDGARRPRCHRWPAGAKAGERRGRTYSNRVRAPGSAGTP